MSLLSSSFVSKMEQELINNQHKGDWALWHPNEYQAISELQHHFLKLENALFSKDKTLISEYSADIANICEKIFTEFGEN